MKKRYTDEQIIAFLKQAESDVYQVADANGIAIEVRSSGARLSR